MKRRLVYASVLTVVAAIIGLEMVRSLTPAVHPDHDHALQSIDAGGFLYVQGWDKEKRNLVGRPGRFLVLHWFALSSQPAMAEMPALLAFARQQASDPRIEVVLIAAEDSWEELRQWARGANVPTGQLYRDAALATGRQFGVRQLPETLIYDPSGRLAHQARGAIDWTLTSLADQIVALRTGGG